MTEIIVHRRNTMAELAATPFSHGVEVDIRSSGGTLIIHHDPFAGGERFEDWIALYRHGLLILNVKEEGLEERLLDLMARHQIERFFFLDQSFPFLLRTARRGERRCAVRVSEYETIDTALNVAPLVDWAWVDCFSRLPLDPAGVQVLKAAGLKLCLVSPELQDRDAESAIPAMRREVAALGAPFDAVCTKRADLWA